MKQYVITLLCGLLIFPFSVSAELPPGMNQLLIQIKEAGKQEQLENQKRERVFLKQQKKQAAVLRKIKSSYNKQLKQKRLLDEAIQKDAKTIKNLKKELKQKQGKLAELSHLFRQSATDLSTISADSLTRFQFPKRQKQLEQLSSQVSVPGQDELQALWFLYQQEMIETGNVTTQTLPLITPEGKTSDMNVTRYGVFAATSGEQYLKAPKDGKRLQVLDRSPETDWISLDSAPDHFQTVQIDPTRGDLFRMMNQTPTLQERIRQGKSIGFGIIFLGIVGLIIAAVRIFSLYQIRKKVRQQLKSLKTPTPDNPLGRIMEAYRKASHLTLENLEVKLDEAIQKEVAGLEKGQSFLKLLAAVAPLLGLLGTVTGMITTFQSITLFGTGDPKLMAGGISQALVTTALGLVSAIPLLFSHSILSGFSRSLTAILEDQSIGLIARFVDHSTRDSKKVMNKQDAKKES